VEVLRNVVGGERVEPRSDVECDGESDIVDPATGTAYARAPISGGADLDLAFTAAERGFTQWRDATPAARSRALLAVADTLEAHTDELVDLEVRNTGKPRASMLRDEIPHILDCVRYFAGAARHLEGLSAGEYVAGHTSFLRREPVGVVAQVTPWNYPLMMAVWKWAPAVAAGNAVVLKPAETTPVTPLRMAELAAQHLPAGVLNVVCGTRATGQALVRHPVPAMVSISSWWRRGRWR